MKFFVATVGLMCIMTLSFAEPAPQTFEGRLIWSCLGNWFHEKQTDKHFALIFDDATIESHQELRIPTFPTAAARRYDILFEGTITTDQSCYPQAPCDWRSWPNHATEPAGCIYVTKIITLERK
ncbi:MAG TPA: hypothetical protein DDY17_02595 [Syntrophaceae bacterium]|jgi:hypothetical protein|nr:hypothetical protein [Syntrophaceae bacterium]